MKPVFVGIYTNQGPLMINANSISYFEEKNNLVTLYMNDGKMLEILENAASFIDKVKNTPAT